ncbi:phospholipid-transporting ATPase ABCA3-like isoform X2 [Haemaphysalis longicornis]
MLSQAAIYLTNMADEAENLTRTNLDASPFNVEAQTAITTDAQYRQIVLTMFPCLVGLCVVQPFLVKKTTSELVSGTKEFMVVNGLSELLWSLGSVSWSFVMLSLSALPVLGLLKFTSLLPRANVLALMVGLLMHCASSALNCLLVASLVPRPSVGLVTMSFVVFSTLLVPIVLSSSISSQFKEDGPLQKIVTLCTLLPNVAFYYFLVNARRFDQEGLHGTSPYSTLLAMIGSSVISIVLTWYSSKVWPHSYAFPQKFWFFLQPSYWGWWSGVGVTEENVNDVKENAALFEPLREQKHAPLIVYRLSKLIDPPLLKSHIIQDVTIKCFMDSITVILGRNGCGKSVLIRMLAGAIKPSSGTAFFDGMDMRTNLSKVRANLGYCPQYTTLIPYLTVEENLAFLAVIRDDEEVEDLMLTVLMQFQLIERKDTLAGKLSYSDQRRLQVAMALLDSPEFGLFDNPTAGIDSESRNIIWDALLKNRAQCTVLLSTNSSDEAEILGDRIAIISKSVISCCGSSIYLRRKYGQGYRLQMTLASKCDRKEVCGFVEKKLPGVEKLLERRHIVVYRLGFASPQDLVRLLQELEDHRVRLHVRRLAISASSLEDVLLRHDELAEKIDAADADKDGGDARAATVPERRTDMFMAQLGAIMTKKTTYLRRSYVVMPLLLFTEMLMLTAEELYLRAGITGWNRIELLYANFTPPQSQADALDVVSNAATEVHTTIFGQRLAGMLLVPMSLTLSTAAFVDLPLKERQCGLKLMQLMSGLSSERYWIATYATDLLTHVVSSLACGIPMLVFDKDVWACRDHYKLGTTFGLYFMFGWAFFPLTYLASLVFESSLLAYFSLVSFGALFGTVWNVILSVFAPRTVSTFRPKGDVDNYVEMATLPLRIIPQFTLARGTGQLRSAHLERAACCHLGARFYQFICAFGFQPTNDLQTQAVARMLMCCAVTSCDKVCPDYESRPGPILNSSSHVWDLVILFLSGQLYLMVVVAWDLRSQGRFSPQNLDVFKSSKEGGDHSGAKTASTEERSVQDEKAFVANLMRYLLTEGADGARSSVPPASTAQTDTGGGNPAAGDAAGNRAPAGLVVLEAAKADVLGPVSFHVPPAEVFGILGLAQSGRSLLLRVIAGIVRPDVGNVYVNGIDVLRKPLSFQQHVGYCPQQDPVMDKYTGEEVILLMARLRGLKKHDLQGELAYLNSRLGLKSVLTHKISMYTSTTSLRKLSVAMALAGRPPVVVLDECTEGVDPGARSRLFQALVQVQTESKITVLFTSRRMSESDIFCDRLAILSNGKFVVVGRTGDIKQSCGQRCNVVIKMREEQQGKKVSKMISRAVNDMFPNSVIAEVRKDQLWFRIRDDIIYWSEVFEGLEELKARLKFADYLVNDMALGEIYLGYARERKVVDFGTIEIKYFDKLRPPGELEAAPNAEPPPAAGRSRRRSRSKQTSSEEEQQRSASTTT